MSRTVEIAQKKMIEIIQNAAKRAEESDEFPSFPTDSPQLEVPADREKGDVSCNAAFVWAKSLRMAPKKIAEIIVNNIQIQGSFVERCEVAAPGFLNFFWTDEYYSSILREIYQQKERYGCSDFGLGQRVLVEFVSANPTGPMHMGNARGAALGDCLASVLEMAGFSVEREFYVNDAGNQIEKLGLSLDIRYRQLHGEVVDLPEDAYHGEDIQELARAFSDKFGKNYLQKTEKERREALVKFSLPVNIDKMKQNMEKYRINYNTWFYESSLYESGEVARVLELLENSVNTYQKEGALWFRATDFGCDKDFVLRRSNGLPTYIIPDIAYHYNKLITRGFDRVVDILGSDHHGYSLRLRAILGALGIDTTRLDVILMQLVRLVRDGEVVRMSKRTGKSITLSDLLDEIPIDALRFLFNMRDPGSAMDFDLDVALEESSKNPSYYCQYAHARICSIFARFEEEGVRPRECSSEELNLLKAPEERELIRLLGAFTGEIVEAAKRYDPTRVTRYCIDLAAQFHKFYNNCHIKGEEEPLLQARLQLCACVRTVLASALRMFKIETPQSM